MSRSIPLRALILAGLLATAFHSVHAQYPGRNPHHALLEGAIDLHTHTAPDAFDRSVDDLALAALARRAGLRAFVLKNHGSSTAARAELVNAQVEGVTAFGGIVLNRAVGGINPAAVEWMVRLSPAYGKVVWFPTVDAGTLSVLDATGALTAEAEQVLSLIAQHGLVLATGHLPPREALPLLRRARALGVDRLLVTHALADAPGMNAEELREAVDAGALIELTYLSHLSGPASHMAFLRGSRHVSVEQMTEVIRTLGAAHVVLTTDLGQSGNATPPDGLLHAVTLLLDAGIGEDAIVQMIRTNPARLLGLTPR